MSERLDFPIEGGCTCGAVRYRVSRDPLIVHCCHCYWCQRGTGSAFVINALVESAAVELLAGELETTPTPTPSGKGQDIMRCSVCQVAVWSHYSGLGDKVSFVRVGTLDEPDQLPPDIHIYTDSRQPWLILPETVRSVPEYYDLKEYWTEDSQQRLTRLFP